MKQIKLGIIGAGNIVKTRHLPCLYNNKLFDIIGIIDLKDSNNINIIAKTYNIPNKCSYEKYKDLYHIKWFTEVEAVIIATPPEEHYKMIKMCLELSKHVLVEKPFVTNIQEGEELLKLANDKNLILAVNHNFQFSNSFTNLYNIIQSNDIGEIKSFYSIQMTNDQRRLPIWADSLPLGLFYDETPHVFYLLKKFSGGKLSVNNVYIHKSNIKENTPQLININLMANNIPASIYINFESPICEWYFTIVGTKQIAVIDMFRDILILLPSDGQHLMKEVFITSVLTTFYHWKGVFFNGIKYILKKLYYGFDITHGNFYKAIINNDQSYIKFMTGEDGLDVNKIQFTIIDKSRL